MSKGKWYVMAFQNGDFVRIVPIMLRKAEIAGAERHNIPFSFGPKISVLS